MTESQAKRPYLLIVLLMLMVSAKLFYHWHGLPYEPDETWTVHLGVQTTAPELLQRIALHDWTALPAPWLLLQGWTRLFGHHEAVVRYAQWLVGLLTLALTYQLGRRLHSSNADTLMVALYAATPLFMQQAPQARSYALYAMTTVALMILFLRWLDRPTFWHALGYVMVGIVGVYSHQYVIYAIIAQAAYLLIGVRWRWGRVIRGFAMFAMVGGAFVAVWGAVIVHALGLSEGGIGYGIRALTFSFLLSVAQFNLVPPLLLAFALIGLFASRATSSPSDNSPHRWPRHLPAAYMLIWLVAALTLVVVVNNYVSVNVTVRNLLLFIVPLNALIAVGLMLLPARPRVVLVGVVIALNVGTYSIGIPLSFRNTAAKLAPYTTDETARIIVQTDSYWLHIETMYYLQGRYNVSPERIGGLTKGEWDRGLLVMQPAAFYDYSDADQLSPFVGDAPRIVWLAWHPDLTGNITVPDIDAPFLADYFARPLDIGLSDATATLYTRKPDVDAPQVRFQYADLMAWNAPHGLTAPACDSVPLHTWWQSADDERPNMSLTLTLIGADGGELARSEGRLTQAETALWDTNALQLDERTLSIGCDVPAGSYALLAAISADGEPLPTLDADGTPNGPAYTYLTNIEVTP